MIGESPLKRGVPGEISKDAMKHLAETFESFVEIKQANGDTDEESRKNMASILKNVVSSASTADRKGYKKLNRLLRETAINISTKVEHLEEYQQKQWKTYGNINLFFDTWDKDLVELGFAYRDDEEKIVITDEKLGKIINFDESCISLDGSEGRRGGIPPVKLFNRGLPHYVRSASKSSVTTTFITGISAAGEALPPNFQFTKKSKERDWYSI